MRRAGEVFETYIVCNGGDPLGGLASGSDFDWDGADGDLDGTIGGSYLGC